MMKTQEKLRVFSTKLGIPSIQLPQQLRLRVLLLQTPHLLLVMEAQRIPLYLEVEHFKRLVL
jgi:hypothetical protein